MQYQLTVPAQEFLDAINKASQFVCKDTFYDELCHIALELHKPNDKLYVIGANQYTMYTKMIKLSSEDNKLPNKSETNYGCILLSSNNVKNIISLCKNVPRIQNLAIKFLFVPKEKENGYYDSMAYIDESMEYKFESKFLSYPDMHVFEKEFKEEDQANCMFDINPKYLASVGKIFNKDTYVHITKNKKATLIRFENKLNSDEYVITAAMRNVE